VKNNFSIYTLLLLGVISLFAACKQTNSEGESAEETAITVIDSEEIELKEIDDLSEAPIPTTLSLASTKSQYSFTRNKNYYPQDYFRNPFDSAIYVSGTFCELRGNHFHAGLDIRTGGMEGWEVLAAADGYIERVKVSTTGYGRVVYIRHPNGYTSVYGHLKELKGTLANYVKDAQYKQRKFEIELYPKPGEIKVTKGQNFALSGNTGGSGGPHLHFEIRNSKGQSTNPLLHGLNVSDNLKPEIKRISVYLKDKEALYTRGNYAYITMSKWSDYLKNTKTLNLQPGNYSFGLFTDDYFTDKKNVLGINYCWLTANGKLLYEYQIEKFNFNQGRYIYTHTDPYLKWKENKTYFRLFQESYNPLPYYKQRQNGEIYLHEGDSVQMKLYIQDYAGLTDSVVWVAVGDTTAKALEAPAQPVYNKQQRISGSTSFSYQNWDISISKKAVYHPFDFKMTTGPKKPKMLSETFQMHFGYTPLHTYIQVSRTIPAAWIAYGDKLCAVSFNGSRTYYEGGTLTGNKLHFKTRSLGQYAISYDDEDPKLTPLYVGRSFRFRVSDNLSGVDHITCSINGKWILAEYEPKTGKIWGEIPKWIKAGTHDFTLLVKDSKGNKVTYQKDVKL
jgi:murein DD-endopeptidase MepM/ murein hydrolase activator NlpD